jgi:type IV pilus assembly protein PilC
MIDKLLESLLFSRKYAKFSIKEKIFFFREMAFLIEGGVSETVSLDVIKSTTDNPALHHICNILDQELNKWESFASSMFRLPEYFPENDVQIIKSWEALGEITKVFRYLADEYEFLGAMKNKYISALLYPVLLFFISCGAVYLLFTTILPGIFNMVLQFDGVEIPWTTQMLMNISTFLQVHGTTLGIVLLIVWSIAVTLFSTDSGREYVDTWTFQIPVVWKLAKQYYLITFLRYMKLLIYSWLQYVDVFLFLKDIMQHHQYKVAIQDVIDNIQIWNPIAATLMQYSSFIPMDVIMLLRVGEETATFDTALGNAIRIYEDEFQKSVEWLSKLLEPILIVFVWWIIALIAVSVFGIIGNLLGSLQI